MKILFFCWGTNNENRIMDAFSHLPEYEVVTLTYKIVNYNIDLALSRDLLFMIQNDKCDCIFSLNFIPILSDVAKVAKIKYVSWIQDSPNLTLYYETVSSPYNLICSFDSYECQRLSRRTNANVHYMPLASSPSFWANKIASNKAIAPEVISFVGSSYKNNYYDKATNLSEYEKGFYDALLAISGFVYGSSLIEETLTLEQATTLLDKCSVPVPKDFLMTTQELAAYVLEQKLTSIQRQNLILAIAEKYKINIYSGQSDWSHPNINYKGYANYENDMPAIFHSSAINLNFSLRSIHSGIPLRVLDILACGGFCISNYQPDIADAFNDNEIVLFDSKEDLLEKVEYYMNHSSERKSIATAGKKKIVDLFSYEYQLKRIFYLL